MPGVRINRWVVITCAAALAGGGAAAAIAVAQLESGPGNQRPARTGVHFPGATGEYDIPVQALNGASPDSYATVGEADGVVAAEHRGAATGQRCVIIASVTGAVTSGCWKGDLKPGTLVWAYDEADGSQSVAFATDARAASGRVGKRTVQVSGGSDIAVMRLPKGETLPIQIHHGTGDYTVAFPGGTATR